MRERKERDEEGHAAPPEVGDDRDDMQAQTYRSHQGGGLSKQRLQQEKESKPSELACLLCSYKKQEGVGGGEEGEMVGEGKG